MAPTLRSIRPWSAAPCGAMVTANKIAALHHRMGDGSAEKSSKGGPAMMTDTREQTTSTNPAMAPPNSDMAWPDWARIVILGGGVAGLTAAYELRRRLGN